MKVIIKPIGLIVLITALSVLSFLAFRGSKTEATVVASQLPQTSASIRVAPPSVASPDGNLIANGDFELPGQTVKLEQPTTTSTVPAINAKITGDISGELSWFDNSSWANLTAEYATDKTIFHTGKQSQRVELKKATPGQQIQFAQIVQVPLERDYEVTAWVRASHPSKVTMAMRIGDQSILKNADVRAGTEWRKVAMRIHRRTAPNGERDGTWIMLFLREPGITYWIDDVEVLPLHKAVASR